MRRTRYLTIALLIFSITSAASASQCSDRHLEEFSSQGGKDAWLKRMRGVQSQAKQALRTGVWSDGEKLSNERLRQIREVVQDIEEDIAEAAACSLPGQSASTSSPTRGNPPGNAASNCSTTFSGDQTSAGPWIWKRTDDTSASLLNPYGNEYASSSLQDLASGKVDMGSGFNQKTQLQEWARCHLATRKGGAQTTAAKGNQPSSAASNCPSEYSWPFSAGCGSKLRVLPNGHLLFNGCPEAGDTWKDEGQIGASNDRRGLGWPGLDEFYECHLAARKGNSVTANSGAASTQSGPNVGNASEVNGRKEGGKSAWKRGGSQTSQSQSKQASDTGVQGSNGSQKSKYVSKDATHCVEIVPKGFKCDGPYDRFLTNICMTKISVRWRLGADPWGMQELAPKGCTPVSPFRDQRGVQFKACSWDPKANHGPYSDPCRY